MVEKLIIDGMNQCWFAVGLLQAKDSNPAMLLGADSSPEVFARPLLRKFIYWLPEIVSLSDRFAWGIERIVRYSTDPNVEMSLDCWTLLLYLCHICGYGGHPNELKGRIRSQYRGDILNALVEEKVVKHSGERFELQA
ncbi:hypothetical protein AYO44_05150 [Planctomycetaceae bacterium SCGC AG-212-F19]|nr:hypothetical protein AYO44_05150 [Planctomycetaceae bacterium SCGC AG-212-F19]